MGDELGISSYGVSMTTLEEVFLHLGEQEGEAGEEKAEKQSGNDLDNCCSIY